MENTVGAIHGTDNIGVCFGAVVATVAAVDGIDPMRALGGKLK